MKILIDVKSGLNYSTIVADTDKNSFMANGLKVDLNLNNFIFKVCDITINWPNYLNNEVNIIDGTDVYIIIQDDNNVKKMQYINKLPNNYYKLDNLLNEVFEYVETKL